MIKVAVFNFKGGTGKTTTTLNLGSGLANLLTKILLIDLDGQRTLSYALKLDGATPNSMDFLNGEDVQPLKTHVPHLDLIPGTLEMFKLTAQSDLFTPALGRLTDYHTCLMDCSPGLGIASVQAILTSDRILIPLVPEPANLKGLSEAIELIRSERPTVPIDILRVRYRPRLRLTQDIDALLKAEAQAMNFCLLETTIPDNIAVAEAIAYQTSVLDHAPNSQGAKAYEKLATEYLEKIND